MRDFLAIMTMAAAIGFGACSGDDEGDEGEAESESEAEADLCETYCECMEKTCPDAFTDGEACRTECQGVPEGAEGDEAGNTVQCRIYHCNLAGADSDTHCPHAAGDAICM
ncbi:MAG: hypothetical protein AABZ30_04990 [Myxococcota bacterium]